MTSPAAGPLTGTDTAPAKKPVLKDLSMRIFRRADARHVPLRTILTTITVVVVVYLAGKVLYRIRDVLLLLVVGGFMAMVLNPPVAALQRRGVPRRGHAVAIVTLLSLLVLLGLGFAFGYPLVNGVNHFATSLPTYIKRAEHGRGWVGHLVLRYHVEAWVKRNAPRLVSLAEGLAKPAFALGRGAVSVLAALGATYAFVILLLLEAPKLRGAALDSFSPERAERYRQTGAKVSQVVSGFVLGDLLTSVVAGLVMLVTLTVLGVPYAALWALWVALVDFLPTIGGALAGIPTVLFAFTHSLTAGIITAVVFVAYTQIENHVLNPVVMSRTVKISPLLVFVAVLVGADLGAWVGGLFGGFVAVLLAVPLAGAAQVIVHELGHPGSAGAAPPLPIDVGGETLAQDTSGDLPDGGT